MQTSVMVTAPIVRRITAIAMVAGITDITTPAAMSEAEIKDDFGVTSALYSFYYAFLRSQLLEIGIPVLFETL